MKSLWPWLLIGLALRIFLSAVALHPDIRGHNFAAYLISQKGGLLTFYDHLRHLPRADPMVQLYGDGLFIYPPLTYWTHALFMKALSPLYPWDTFWRLILDMGQLKTNSAGLSQLLLLLKFPYLVADLLCLLVLLKLVGGKHRFLASLLWIFNPVTIYSSYLLAQLDIFIALFILLALYFSQKNRHLPAAVSIGLAASFKPFPLFLLPFLPGPKIKNIVLGLSTYALPLLPYLGSVGFKHYALLAAQSDKLWFAKIPVSGGQYLPLFAVGLALLFWWNYYRPKNLPVWGWLGAVLALFFSLTHYHPQWFTWLAPILVLSSVLKPTTRFPILVLSCSYILILFSFEPSLNFGLFNLNYALSWLLTDQNVSLVRGLFAAASLAWAWQVGRAAFPSP